jgi:hypothetical protein
MTSSLMGLLVWVLDLTRITHLSNTFSKVHPFSPPLVDWNRIGLYPGYDQDEQPGYPRVTWSPGPGSFSKTPQNQRTNLIGRRFMQVYTLWCEGVWRGVVAAHLIHHVCIDGIAWFFEGKLAVLSQSDTCWGLLAAVHSIADCTSSASLSVSCPLALVLSRAPLSGRCCGLLPV